MIFSQAPLQEYDPAIADVVADESKRQQEHIELIASENYASPQVMALQGSVLTNKYAEGYPGKRYYGGCEFVDRAELLAIERLCQLFDAKYANVQPHSGSQANAAVYQALLNAGDTVLGMDLAQGGHLTHGCKVNFSGKMYHSYLYGLDKDGVIDYAQVAALAKAHKPKMIIAGFSAYSGIVDWAKFREIADSIGAYLFADIAHVAGLVAAGIYPSPLPYAHVVTSTTHKTLRGPRGGVIMSAEDDPDLHKRLNSAIFPGSQGGPLMHIIAAKAVAFKEALDPSFKTYQEQVVKNAKAMAQAFMAKGHKVVSHGTENHMFLLDLIGHQLTGKEAEKLLGSANMTVNKNTVPGDPASPFVTSGLRFGTPACTTRGFKEAECRQIVDWVCELLDDSSDATVARVRSEVVALCDRFPVY